MHAIVLALQLLGAAPGSASLDLGPPLRPGELPAIDGSATSRLQFGEVSASELAGEIGAGTLGVVAADLVALGAGGLVGIPVALAFSGGDGFGGIAGVMVGGLTFLVLDFALAPAAAVLTARMVDRDHPGSEQRSLVPPMLAAYATKLLVPVVIVASLALGSSVRVIGEFGALLGLVGAVLVQFVGVPAAASFALHTQQVKPKPSEWKGYPAPPPGAFQPVPPPPSASASRAVVFPVMSFAF